MLPLRRGIVLSLLAWALGTGGVAAQPRGPEVAYVPGSTRRVCQLTGDFDRAARKKTQSETGKRFGIEATDLGSSFEHKGKLYFLFGDTWGRPGDRDVLAWTEGRDPAKLLLQFHKADDGKWLPLTVPRISQAAFEVPSGGISIENAMYVVFTTDHTEEKVMGRSVLARSRDDGVTFENLYNLSRGKFINVSFWLADDGWLYLYGSGKYRKSNVYLARVKPADLADRSKLEYFSGNGPADVPRWALKEAEAVALFKHPEVGEFSFAFLPPLKRYVMLYNTLEPRGIMLRSAPAPWGPWSDGTILFEPWRDHGYGHFLHISADFKEKRDLVPLSDPKREKEWGGEYGPYVMARFTTGSNWACRIYYTMSTWNPYQVVVMQSDLALQAAK